MKRAIILSIVTGSLLLGAGMTSAQGFGREDQGARPGGGLLGPQSGPVEVKIYTEDPAGGAEAIATLTLEDPGAALRQALGEHPDAAFLVLSGEDFTRTVDLAELGSRAIQRDLQARGRELHRRNDARRGPPQHRGSPRNQRPGVGSRGFDSRGFGPRNSRRGGPEGDALPLVGPLQDGATITATFYDGNPDEGGQVLNTLSFTAGQDDRGEFLQAFRDAAGDAQFVVVDSSPRVIDLSKGPFQPRNR